MIVQIYEIQTPAEAQSMIELGVDHIGSVILSADRRQDDVLKQTVQTVQAAGRKSSLIPLFRDVVLIAQAVAYFRPDIVHFCETLPWGNAGIRDEVQATVKRQTTIRRLFHDIEIMRSIPIVRNGDHTYLPSLELAALFEPVSDWFLTDTVLTKNTQGLSMDEQPVNGFVGITGQTCDWSMARKLVQSSRIPVILAGGLGPLNATQAVKQVQPAGVDSCTQTNAVDHLGRSVRFRKDPEKVRALVESARRARDDLLPHECIKTDGFQTKI